MKYLAKTSIYFSKQLLFAPLLAFCLLFSGCNNTSEQSTTNESPTTPETVTSSPSVTESPTPTTSPTASPEASSSEKAPDIAGIVGKKEEGWMPKILADKNLKENMTPEETGKIIPGAETVSEFGFSEVKVEGTSEIQKYEFYFEKDDAGKPNKLKSVKLVFNPALNSKVSYEEIAKILSEKYGEVKPEDLQKQIVTWVGPDFSTAQFTKGLSDFEGYQFTISVPKQ